ncbi:oligoendopeptidase F [Terrilactibacillus sp. BCM23-1]|uniref:Oligopeptidase F n=1 Tax=Terrilactibacillus tamarindi TaxID=2599694 RepID=A0A6N8CNZ0_9BACI|nr:oligoendopeptidase F [Terrilactibacillus tamarindi]MTT30575.1 oligoendopeptidase F [Terrilactibacillus tamarindi]
MSEESKKSLPTRDQIPENEKWNLEAIYPSVDEWESDFEKVKSLIPELESFKGKLGESPDTLFNMLKKQDELDLILNKLFAYSHMKADGDTANSTYQALNDRVRNLATMVGSKLAYAVPEILDIDEKKLARFLDENKDLQLYRHGLDDITRMRPHVLDEEKEALLAQASEVTSNPSNTFGMLNNADLKFPEIKDENGEEIEVTHGRYSKFMESEDRRVRKDAFDAVYSTYGSFKNTFASTLSGQVKRNNFYANVRNHPSARAAALSGNNIPEAVYENLVKTVNDNLHLLHRYVSLRKRALELDELHIYDLYAPLVKNVKMQIPYEEAKEIVLKGLAPLGEDYTNIIKKGYESRWIDVRETKNKRSGAYSSGTYGTMPYILLNWQDNVNNVFTLAHELGHSMHSYYTRENQPYPYANYSIFVAEVASTCNEALLNHYLLNETDDKKKKLYLLNNQLEGFKGTVFRQTMFAEFEQSIHEKAAAGEALTPELLTSVYYELNERYFGKDLVVDKEIGLEWSRIPHFYYNFYVYQYATGYSAAAALSKQILEEGAPAVERYKNYLKAGSSDYPIEVLKGAGVDMTTSKPIEEAMQVFESVLDETEKLLFG